MDKHTHKPTKEKTLPHYPVWGQYKYNIDKYVIITLMNTTNKYLNPSAPR